MIALALFGLYWLNWKVWPDTWFARYLQRDWKRTLQEFDFEAWRIRRGGKPARVIHVRGLYERLKDRFPGDDEVGIEKD